MKLNLQARLVAAIYAFKAKNDIRYYLNGIYVAPIEGGGAVIVATNGHAMGMWRDITGQVERPAILRVSKDLRNACKECETHRLSIADGRLVVVGADGADVYIQPNDVDSPGWEVPGKFPDWLKVVPDKCQIGPMGAFQPQYAKLVNKALLIGRGSDFASVTLRQSEKNLSILVASPDSPDFAAVIMPVLDDGKGAYPAWLSDMKAKVPAAELITPPTAIETAEEEATAS